MRGVALSNLGDHYDSFDAAMKALVEGYGQAENTWDAKVDSFMTKCDKPDAWKKLGSKEMLTVVAGTCEFLREAEKLAKDHPELDSAIHSQFTVKKLIKVLPPEWTVEIVHNGSGTKDPKQKIQEFKTYLDKRHTSVREMSQYSDELNQAQINFGSVNAFDSNKDSEQKKETKDYHQCYSSKTCKTEWGLLGCILLYQLPTIEERRAMINRRHCCFFCGKQSP